MHYVEPDLRWSRTWPDSHHDYALNAHHGSGVVEAVGRVLKDDHVAEGALDHGLWTWAIHCSFRNRFFAKPVIVGSGRVQTKDEAVAALMRAWQREADWRAEVRRVTSSTHGCWPVSLLRTAYGYGWGHWTPPKTCFDAIAVLAFSMACVRTSRPIEGFFGGVHLHQPPDGDLHAGLMAALERRA